MDHTHNFFCLVLSHPDSDMRLYFLNFDSMMEAVDAIVLAQGGSSRLDNYQKVGKLENLSFGDRFMV